MSALDHDWQSVFANPKPVVGERAKTRLLILLCALWVCFGLIGHAPWKTEEMQVVSIVKHMLHSGDWFFPVMAGELWLKNPPLYYLSAAFSAKLFSFILPLHDAARLVNILWVSLTLLFVGMSGRELWGMGSGRQACLLFIGSIGLVFSAHTLNPDVAGLTAYAMAFYALALAPRRAARAGLLLGCGIGAGFMAKGPLVAEVIVVVALLLPLLFEHWRRLSYIQTLILAFIVAFAWMAPWLMAFHQQYPQLLENWLAQSNAISRSFFYLTKTMLWYCWPALPLAVWTLMRNKPSHPSVQLSLFFLLIVFTMLGFGAANRDISLLPLLIPLALLATPAIDTLKRGAAAVFGWFGVMLFGALAVFIWLGWVAMMTGFPAKLAERSQKLSVSYAPEFLWWLFLPALLLTVIWALVVFKSKRTNRAAVTDWAMGMTLCWGLLMTLWLPWLDAAKSYESTLVAMKKSLPAEFACISGKGVGDFQRAAVDYYLDIQIYRFETAQRVECDLYLIEDARGQDKIYPGPEWKLIWQGKRPSDRRESFRLYQLAR